MSVNVKRRLFETLAILGKALSSATRLELLDFLAQGERSVERLAGLANVSVASASQHLQTLLRAGLVTNRREGQKVYYSLSDDSIITLMGGMRVVAERNIAEMERLIATFLKTKDALDPVAPADLIKMIENDAVVIIDVRPADEYRMGHIPGSINIPFKELEGRAREVLGDREIIAYCRGPYCLLSYDAVTHFRSIGQPARRLEDGFPEWKNAHHPVERE
ncbi:MAG: metalloregulator ArsR/SmtB family transcription factor [Nitrospinae bacterium]|nr:metalloregulator ArsR/SmtB family transcription factor [Nitrospinota bacterium]